MAKVRQSMTWGEKCVLPKLIVVQREVDSPLKGFISRQ